MNDECTMISMHTASLPTLMPKEFPTDQDYFEFRDHIMLDVRCVGFSIDDEDGDDDEALCFHKRNMPDCFESEYRMWALSEIHHDF